MKNNDEIIRGLKGLVNIVNDGKEGYESASEATDSNELKGVFLKYAAQRAGYAVELKEHIVKHGGNADGEGGDVPGVLHRAWIDIKQALSRKDDVAILAAIETGEKDAIEKYDKCIEDYTNHEDHLVLLEKHRDGIVKALNNIELLHMQRKH